MAINQYRKGRWKDYNAGQSSKEALEMKKAILDTWEEVASPYVVEVKERKYITGLKARIRSCSNRYEAATGSFYLEDRGDLRNDGRSDGYGESYAERNI